MAQHSALLDNLLIICTAITAAIALPMIRAGRRRTRKRRHDTDLRDQLTTGRDTNLAILRAVIDHSQSLVYVKDLEGRFLLVNNAFQTAFGITEDDILGKTDDHLDPALAPTWQANDRRARNGGIHLEETTQVNGEQRTYESNKFPLYDATGTVYAVCGVSPDVTDLRRATANAVQARDEAIAQSRLKTEFMATMSHEIRTPMNGILGLAGLLLNTSLDETQRRYATGINTAGTALLGIINDILDFAKIEAGKIILDPHDFDLYAVLTETAALVTPAADDKGLTLVTRRGSGLPTLVHGDAGRLRQILLNLATNAVKFTGKGSITLRADLVPTRPGSDAVVIRFDVTDTGIGITPTDADRLFEPFTQADASTTSTYGGTGLGLAISRQLTEAMGGTIGLDSEPGQGSTFHFEIPFELAHGTTAPTGARNGHALRILVVGTGADRDALTDDLRRWQMTATTADTAADARTAVHDAAARGRPYDVLPSTRTPETSIPPSWPATSGKTRRSPPRASSCSTTTPPQGAIPTYPNPYTAPLCTTCSPSPPRPGRHPSPPPGTAKAASCSSRTTTSTSSSPSACSTPSATTATSPPTARRPATWPPPPSTTRS